ncbi:MAG: hypothetical protein QUV71_05435 [Rhizobium sp.]|nr:hypothetical protein [Rhizobium sp.]MDM8012760.1 hypothetical protein [Rhizobium sp.]
MSLIVMGLARQTCDGVALQGAVVMLGLVPGICRGVRTFDRAACR